MRVEFVLDAAGRARLGRDALACTLHGPGRGASFDRAEACFARNLGGADAGVRAAVQAALAGDGENENDGGEGGDGDESAPAGASSANGLFALFTTSSEALRAGGQPGRALDGALLLACLAVQRDVVANAGFWYLRGWQPVERSQNVPDH